VRVERGFEAPHDLDLGVGARVVQIVAAQRADTVLRRDRSAVCADRAVHGVAQPLEVAREVGRDREMKVAVADVSEHEVRDGIGKASERGVDRGEERCHRVDRQAHVEREQRLQRRRDVADAVADRPEVLRLARRLREHRVGDDAGVERIRERGLEPCGVGRVLRALDLDQRVQRMTFRERRAQRGHVLEHVMKVSGPHRLERAQASAEPRLQRVQKLHRLVEAAQRAQGRDLARQLRP
jgi:hypothetical protein